jgi:hypothetical protein
MTFPESFSLGFDFSWLATGMEKTGEGVSWERTQ